MASSDRWALQPTFLHAVNGSAGADRLTRAFGVAGWGVAVASVGCYVLFGRSDTSIRAILIVTIAVFFLVLGARLVAAFVAQPTRRPQLAVLITTVLTWSAGSAALNASPVPDLTRFPSPGEIFFLISYLGFAGYLMLDARGRDVDLRNSGLDAMVLCGGTASVVGLLVLEPVSRASGHTGLALFTAILYPMLDLALLLVVVAQLSLGVRRGIRSGVELMAAFALFTGADSQFMLDVSGAGIYDISVGSDILWGVGFMLAASSACRRPRIDAVAPHRRPNSIPMVLASGCAVVVLIVRPAGSGNLALTAVATITMIAAAGRMVLALREAHGAAEAFALSRTDDLTLLPNRRAVLSRIDTGLATGAPMALMLLDLDGFKDVNDTLGHGAGDTVLQVTAERLRRRLPHSALVGRLGGDEFALVVPMVDEVELIELGRDVLGVVAEPVTVEGITMSTSASLGIAISKAQDRSSAELLRRADIAMYQAKVDRAGALIYDAGRDDFSRYRLQLADELRRAIPEGQLVLWYQPQVAAATQEVVAVEALIRWQHPDRGLLSPIEFLPAARRAGLMLQVTEAVLANAIRDLHGWIQAGLDVRVAINCAPPELLNGFFLPTLFQARQEGRIPADRFVVEVTEDAFLAEPERARAILHQIRDHQVEIAIDDYGTGFSSLSYLRDLPVNEIKVDRSFVQALQSDPRSRVIVASTVQMARALGLRTVAEGVEDAATMADLVAMGVDMLQGYHLARPMPAAELPTWLTRWRPIAV